MSPLQTAQAELAAHEAAYRAHADHLAVERAHKAAKPQPPKSERPAAPPMARPTTEEQASARTLLSQAAKAEATADAARRALQTAQQAHQDAQAAVTASEAEAARVVALVAALRRAPGECAAEQVAALGLPGWLRVEFAGEDRGRQDPYVRVLVDGLPWELASTGRQVVADLELRLALSRVAKLDALPVVVDNVRAWSGEWPTVRGQSVWLVTAKGGAS